MSTIDDYKDLINKDLYNRQETIGEILEKIENIKFDYIVYSAMFPYANIIGQILKLHILLNILCHILNIIAKILYLLDHQYMMGMIIWISPKGVLTNPSYLENIKKISSSFKQTGGYQKAVEEIFKLKKQKQSFD